MRETTDHIVDLIERLGRIARSAQHAEGMKPAQWEALRFLARANRFSRTPGALADFLSSTRGTVSQTLIALDKKGLIKRKANLGDARIKQLELTKEGRAIVNRDPLHMLEKAVASVGEEPGLAENLERILRNIIHQHGNRPFGVCLACRHFRCDGASSHARGPHRCMLSGEPLSDVDSNQICREHEARAA
ncbi:MAG: MarR family transcriptional regulator [Rhodospirillales bacterium]|nr:MarR family transcriptional regulator [Rhodospirillales bacterium]